MVGTAATEEAGRAIVKGLEIPDSVPFGMGNQDRSS